MVVVLPILTVYWKTRTMPTYISAVEKDLVFSLFFFEVVINIMIHICAY